MMWNLLISGLLVGATVVAFDGSPGHPDLDVLWRMAADEGVTVFGTSASFVQSCLKAGLRPRDAFDLSAIRSVGSTGSPLSPEGFDWLQDAVGEKLQIASVSGGTDVCAAFVGVAPTVPVWRGEISCRALGASVEAFDPTGRPVIDEVGELVITRPMPSMPVMLWNDPDGSRMRESYFEDFPGIWRHGDWVQITPRGSLVIRGRSDSTLNRGGVRMGTAEFYEVVESFDEVVDSLVIDTSGVEGAREGGELLCFLVLGEGVAFDDVAPQLKKALRTQLSPRHVPDRFLVVDDIPRTLNGKKSEVPVKRILAGTAAREGRQQGRPAQPRGAGGRGGAGAGLRRAPGASGVGRVDLRQGDRGAEHGATVVPARGDQDVEDPRVRRCVARDLDAGRGGELAAQRGADRRRDRGAVPVGGRRGVAQRQVGAPDPGPRRVPAVGPAERDPRVVDPDDDPRGVQQRGLDGRAGTDGVDQRAGGVPGDHGQVATGDHGTTRRAAGVGRDRGRGGVIGTLVRTRSAARSGAAVPSQGPGDGIGPSCWVRLSPADEIEATGVRPGRASPRGRRRRRAARRSARGPRRW